jgi:hypothetical protein
MADAIGPALLLVLDTLTPAERLAFVLHDMFAVPFPEIAEIVGCSPAAARQLASRARRRVQGQTARSASPAGSQPSSSPMAPATPHPAGKSGPIGPQPASKTHPTGPQPISKTNPTGPQPISKTNPIGPQPISKTNPIGPQPISETNPTGPQPTGKTDPTGMRAPMGGSRPDGETIREASRTSAGADTSVARDVARRRTVVDAFLTASRSGDFTALLALLDPDVVLRADAAGVRTGAAGLVRGANAVAETFSGRARGARLALINGAPGLVWSVNNQPRVVFTFTIADQATTDRATTDQAATDQATTDRATTDGAVIAIELLADPETLATLHLEPIP